MVCVVGAKLALLHLVVEVGRQLDRLIGLTEPAAELFKCRVLAERQRGKITYKVSTYRPPQPRYIADEREAEEAFAREVTASLQDPVIVALMERGAI